MTQTNFFQGTGSTPGHIGLVHHAAVYFTGFHKPWIHGLRLLCQRRRRREKAIKRFLPKFSLPTSKPVNTLRSLRRSKPCYSNTFSMCVYLHPEEWL